MAELVVAVLSPFLNVALEKLASRQVFDFFRERTLDENLPKRLKLKLQFIDPLVADAELKQFSNGSVRAWLDAVRDVVMDAEDLLDDIDIQVTESKLNEEAESESESQTCTCNYKVWNFFKPSSISSFDKEVEPRMKKVLEMLDFLSKEKDDLGLKNASGVGVESSSKVSPKLQSISLKADNFMSGRDVDRKKIFDLLNSPTENGNKLSIISIVGMGGLGKTTLAQHVFNDPGMEGKFDIKAWVCVSDDFDVLRLTRAILGEVTKSKEDGEDLETVCGKLKKNLTAQRFLLVLDDVWNDKRDQWEAVQTPLNYGAQGSKILVTTRSTEVASCMRSEKYILKELEDEHCWKVLAKHAFGDENPQTDLRLEEIGMQIIKKCKGLPLALKTIGGLLYGKSDLQWESVLKSEIWNLPEQHNNIIPALLLSYHHLPSPLKRCFAFCALFPKDYEFDKENLILLWMAENFIQCSQQNKSMEEVGSEYFDDLLSKSFFQQSSEDSMSYVMHDLLNDLAKYVCGDICFRLDDEEAQSIPEKTRHFSLDFYKFEGFKFKGSYEGSKLRTFLPLSRFPHTFYSWDKWTSIMSTQDLLSKFRFVHVLSLSRCGSLTEVPDSVRNLKHLRSLDLSGTKTEKLPDSLCFLFNLQILKLMCCKLLKELPLNLHKLTKLRHLDLRKTKLRKLPTHLGKLENLHVLMGPICVDKGSEFNIQRLGELNLHGKLVISEMQNIVKPSDALAANLKNKINLVKLKLKWSENRDDSSPENDVLENLQPSKNLKELSIENYGGKYFPRWFGVDSLSNVVSLTLSKCKCDKLPSFGLFPSLKNLSIIGLNRIVDIGDEFYGSTTSSFASLETLVFRDMKEWETWEYKTVTGAFTRLRELSIRSCPKLKENLPEQLPCLVTLEIRDCQQLVASLPRAPAIQELALQDFGKMLVDYSPYTLKNLEIDGGYMEGSSLEWVGLTISNASLESLKICGCRNWNFPIHHCYSSLVNLTIESSCDSLTAFPLDFFPNLSYLGLWSFKVQMISQEQAHNHLRKLVIYGCPQFESFPSEGLSAPRLEQLRIENLENLRLLPKQMDTLLPSLSFLYISYCPQVESISSEGLPSNLKVLALSSCSKLMASLKDTLGANTSIETLQIGEVDAESFPDEGLLPLSLTSLSIYDSPNLKELDYKGLCRLSSLTFLSLYKCPSIQCLPEKGLPKSISTLRITGSSLLKQRCQSPNGEDWRKIADIKDVQIMDL